MNGKPEPPSDIQDTCVDLLFLANLCKFLAKMKSV